MAVEIIPLMVKVAAVAAVECTTSFTATAVTCPILLVLVEMVVVSKCRRNWVIHIYDPAKTDNLYRGGGGGGSEIANFPNKTRYFSSRSYVDPEEDKEMVP